MGNVDDRCLELAALQIFENYVGSTEPEPGPVGQHPPSDKAFDSGRPLHGLAGYTSGLACAAGLSGPLGPAVLQGLSEFSAPLLWPEQEVKGGLRTFGSPHHIDEVASRFVDFMSGAVYMAHGDVMLLNDDVLICVPSTVDLHEDRLAFVSGIPTWKGY